jgi:glycyl-tRNA synthetase
MNPNTFLRVLGPAPWSVAYPEPSVRPDDSRYGENPNRLQTHTQFQVLLKPDPGNPQERYLASLEALGIDVQANDVRFVEDNWESPALGAWGLGWEVWLNGLEITQFTYFQQAGGIPLHPVSVEITYGLERILMGLQGKTDFKEIAYSEAYTYGDLFGRAEYEMSKYYLDAANVRRVKRMLKDYETEAQAMLDCDLVLPAYLYVLKLSHAFNVLDARGSVGATERATLFARMRELSLQCAKLWVAKTEDPATIEASTPTRSKPTLTSDHELSAETARLVVEVGTEELPPGDLDALIGQAEDALKKLLKDMALSCGKVHVDGTPRRLVLQVESLQTRQPERVDRKRGPTAAGAWDGDGTPTKAAIGFAARCGVKVDDLRRESIEGKDYAVADVRTGSRTSVEVLAPALSDLLGKLRVTRAMRWNDTEIVFSRPVRWLLALHGDVILPLEFAGLVASNTTRLMRIGASERSTKIATADDFAPALSAAGVVLRRDERRRQILEAVTSHADDLNAEPDLPSELLNEVANLAEHPHVLVGSFDARFLSLPKEVLITVMVKHQRYVPLTRGAKLLRRFAFVTNGKRDDDLVRRGNEAVIQARYADAEFFFRQDSSRRLESFHPHLSGMVFHERLGSIADKVERVEQLALTISTKVGLQEDLQPTLARAARLSKDDLGTSLVTEFPGLAGVMGSYYAHDELPAVAEAIADHVKPTSAGAPLPSTRLGAILGAADRLDTLSGLMAAGVLPRSMADPFGLRRAANGLIAIAVAHDMDFALDEVIAGHAQRLPEGISLPEDEVLAYIWRRLETMLREDGIAPDIIMASLRSGSTSIVTKRAVAHDLAALIDTDQLRAILETCQRANKLAQQAKVSVEIDPTLLQQDSEKKLWEALREAREEVLQTKTMPELADVLEPLTDLVAVFFDEVYIMVDDLELAMNRLAILAAVAALPRKLADLSALRPRDGIR